MNSLLITRAGPMTTIQDDGRFGHLAHGIGASGPMDRGAYRYAQALVGAPCGSAIEVGPLGLDFLYRGGAIGAGFSGGEFRLWIDGVASKWPARATLFDGTEITIAPGPSGTYAYFRCEAEFDVPVILGSRATNATVGLGGHQGRGLRAGDELGLVSLSSPALLSEVVSAPRHSDDPFRFVWGIHAESFAAEVRQAFTRARFDITPRMDRMGVRLLDREGVFANAGILGLVSDAVVPGDIQVLGDGTPIVLMRDNQPTGGYPRIGTIIEPDMDRFAQRRPGQSVRFEPVTVDHAQAIARGGR